MSGIEGELPYGAPPSQSMQEPEMQKAPEPVSPAGGYLKICSAASYSPTGSPLQYHRRCKA